MMRFAAAILMLAALGCQAGRYWSTLDALNSIAPVIALAAAVLMVVALLRRRWLSAIAVLVALAGTGERIVGEFSRTVPHAAPVPDRQVVTIVTHNVRRDNRSPERTVAALNQSGADLLMLQETDGNVGWALTALDARYPYHSKCGQSGCSLIILSRWPITESQWFVHDDGGRMIGPPLVWARIAPPGEAPFTAVTVHFPWPIPAARQAAQRDTLPGVLTRLDRDRMIVAGDMNLTPWAFAMMRLDEQMAPLVRVTRALPSFPARIGSSAWRTPPVLPIDHLFVGHDWTVRSVERLPATGSDHYPIRVRLVARRPVGPFSTLPAVPQ